MLSFSTPTAHPRAHSSLMQLVKEGDALGLAVCLPQAELFLNATDLITGHTLLTYAIILAQHEVIDVLLEQAKINVEQRNSEGLSPLHCAIHSENVSIVRAVGAVCAEDPAAESLAAQQLTLCFRTLQNARSMQASNAYLENLKQRLEHCRTIHELIESSTWRKSPFLKLR